MNYIFPDSFRRTIFSTMFQSEYSSGKTLLFKINQLNQTDWYFLLSDQDWALLVNCRDSSLSSLQWKPKFRKESNVILLKYDHICFKSVSLFNFSFFNPFLLRKKLAKFWCLVFSMLTFICMYNFSFSILTQYSFSSCSWLFLVM